MQPKPDRDGPFFTHIPFDAPEYVARLVAFFRLDPPWRNHHVGGPRRWRQDRDSSSAGGDTGRWPIRPGVSFALMAAQTVYVSGAYPPKRTAARAWGCWSRRRRMSQRSIPMGRMRAARNLRFHDAQVSRWRLGEPRPGMREEMSPERYDRALAALGTVSGDLDVLILDTMAALFALPNENDKPAVTTLMRRLSGMARRTGCAVLLMHHTPKMTREAAAAQRGEATLVRGGGAITNSARVVISLTALPEPEAVQLVMHGLQGYDPPARTRGFDGRTADGPGLCQPAFGRREGP